MHAVGEQAKKVNEGITDVMSRLRGDDEERFIGLLEDLRTLIIVMPNLADSTIKNWIEIYWAE